jgi:hypothetical protein
MKNLHCLLIILIIASCGPSKEEKINELNKRIERLKELKASYSDSIEMKIQEQRNEVNSRIDKMAQNNYRDLLNSEGLLDAEKYSDTIEKLKSYVASRDTNLINSLKREQESTSKKIMEAEVELDKLLNIK